MRSTIGQTIRLPLVCLLYVNFALMMPFVWASKPLMAALDWVERKFALPPGAFSGEE
jgi:hypothetical protein